MIADKLAIINFDRMLDITAKQRVDLSKTHAKVGWNFLIRGAKHWVVSEIIDRQVFIASVNNTGKTTDSLLISIPKAAHRIVTVIISIKPVFEKRGRAILLMAGANENSYLLSMCKQGNIKVLRSITNIVSGTSQMPAPDTVIYSIVA